MILFLLKSLGYLVAHSPEWCLRLLSRGLGSLLYYGFAPRRKTMLHSLACSFPEKAAAWHKRIGRTSCIRMVETGLLSLAVPFFTEDRIRRMAGASRETVRIFTDHARNPKPLVLGTMHLCYWEGLTWIPLFLQPLPCPDIVTIFRPMRDPAMDAWLKSTRERFGIKLMSRKGGLHAASHTLQNNGCVTILFDQSAGSHGYLTLFLGRECSTTPLPGMLLEKSKAELAIIYPKRLDFWRFEIRMESLECDGSAEGATLALNRRLERLLREDEDLCASWLWLHQRWRILDRPEEKRKLEEKRGGLIG